MAFGMISLESLYNFVREKSHSDLLFVLTEKKEYAALCKDLVRPIERCQGFYLWGRYNKRGMWTNIYLGKAGLGKTANLRNRIFKELIGERLCFWRGAYSEEKLNETGQLLHREMWKKYSKNADRAFLKASCTHIAWVSIQHLDNSDVIRVEADLIEAMNPRANLMRPKPPDHLQSNTRGVFELLRACIHAARGTRFSIRLVGNTSPIRTVAVHQP